MFIFPSHRKKKYSFIKENERWWIVLVIDLFAVPGTIIAGKFRKFFTPNGISISSFIVFYISIVLMFIYPQKNVYYTVGFFVSFVFDATDGKLARLRGENSKFGAIVDAFFDMLNHGLGLALVGLATSIRNNSIYPFIIIFPYSLYMSAGHINHITNLINGYIPKKEQPNKEKTKWQKFCDKRGLSYRVYGNVEIIYICILLIGINLKNPNIFLFFAIYLAFIPMIIDKIRKEYKKSVKK